MFKNIMAENSKLKILCIHGYRQNAQMFKEKTGSFRKIVKRHAELVYITAPHRVPPGNMGSAAWESQSDSAADQSGTNSSDVAENGGDSSKNEGERGWWFSREDDYFKAVDYGDVSKGFDSSVEMITKILEDKEEGGFDGILGFSQGASFVSMLCLMQQQQNKDWFKFAVLIAGFKSRSSSHDCYYSGKASSIPSLHVYGETDQIIATEMSEQLLLYFDNPVMLKHPGGHFVPASGPQKKAYIEFLDEMRR